MDRVAVDRVAVVAAGRAAVVVVAAGRVGREAAAIRQ